MVVVAGITINEAVNWFCKYLCLEAGLSREHTSKLENRPILVASLPGKVINDLFKMRVKYD